MAQDDTPPAPGDPPGPFDRWQAKVRDEWLAAVPPPDPRRQQYVSVGALGFCALALLLPWVEVKCNGVTFGTQNGIQVAAGRASLAGELAELQQEQRAKGGPADGLEEGPGGSGLAALYILLVVGGLAAGVAVLVKRADRWTLGPVGAATAAGAVLLLLLLVGVPARQKLAEQRATEAAARAKQGDRDKLALEAAARLAVQFRVEYTAWVWLSLLATAVPAGYLAWTLYGDKVRAALAARPPADPPPAPID